MQLTAKLACWTHFIKGTQTLVLEQMGKLAIVASGDASAASKFGRQPVRHYHYRCRFAGWVLGSHACMQLVSITCFDELENGLGVTLHTSCQHSYLTPKLLYRV